jgi:hypothetical protein
VGLGFSVVSPATDPVNENSNYSYDLFGCRTLRHSGCGFRINKSPNLSETSPPQAPAARHKLAQGASRGKGKRQHKRRRCGTTPQSSSPYRAGCPSLFNLGLKFLFSFGFFPFGEITLAFVYLFSYYLMCTVDPSSNTRPSIPSTRTIRKLSAFPPLCFHRLIHAQIRKLFPLIDFRKTHGGRGGYAFPPTPFSLARFPFPVHMPLGTTDLLTPLVSLY